MLMQNEKSEWKLLFWKFCEHNYVSCCFTNIHILVFRFVKNKCISNPVPKIDHKWLTIFFVVLLCIHLIANSLEEWLLYLCSSAMADLSSHIIEGKCGPCSGVYRDCPPFKRLVITVGCSAEGSLDSTSKCFDKCLFSLYCMVL